MFHHDPPLKFCQLSLIDLNQWKHMWVQLVQAVTATVVLSCDYKDRAVLALCWHVITMASMTTMLGFLELLGTWLFSLAVSHFKQIRHSVCFVIESNKQDKLAGKQWRRVGRCRRAQTAQVLLHSCLLRLKVCVGQPSCCHRPCAHVL